VSNERRKYPRITVLPADLRVEDAKPYDVTSIVDLSLGGMKLELTGEAPKLHSLIDVTLIYGTQTLKVNATVRHVTAAEDGKHSIGVEFDDPDLIKTLAGDLIPSRPH
jgi:c-di-GMP-binding flagellar brake protein YcgR